MKARRSDRDRSRLQEKRHLALSEDGRTGMEQFLPSGTGLIELALQAGFVVPVLLGRSDIGVEDGHPVGPKVGV